MAEANQTRIVGEIHIHPLSAGQFEWTIQNYFSLPQETNFHLRSSEFPFLDAAWRVFIIPNGDQTRSTDGWVGLYLQRVSSSESSHQVTYRFSIMKKDGNEYKSHSENVLFKGNVSFGIPGLVKTSQLKKDEEEAVPGGILTILINLSAKGEETSRTEMPKSVDKLLKDFKNLLDTGVNSDVTILVKEKEFKVHKAILVARSPVLLNMFKHDLAETRSGVVKIDDCDPETFEDFLAYLYTGKLEDVTQDNVIGLYKMADKYSTGEMKDACVRTMMENMTVDSFCDVVCLALERNEQLLLEKANSFFAENIRAILETDKWTQFAEVSSKNATELVKKALDYLIPDRKKC